MMGTPRRLLRAAGSVFGLGALAGGVPALLVLVVGWPLPHGLPRLDEVRTALAEGWKPDERFVLGLLALVFWVLWAQLLRHVASQLGIELRARRNAPAVGGAEVAPVVFAVGGRRGPTQRLASWLVGGLLLAAPLVPSAAIGAPAPRIPVVLSVTQAMADPLMSLAAPAKPFVPVVAVTSAPSYMVHTWADRRDCLWNIAERHLGDPFRWTEIRDLNAERVQPDGRRLGDEPRSWVYPGWELILPSDATGADVVPAPPLPPAAAPTAPTAATPAPTAPSATASPATSVSPPTTARSSTTTVTVSAPPVTLPVAGRSTPPTATSPTAPATTNGMTPQGRGSVVALSPWATRAALAGALGLPIFALGGWLTRLRRGRVAQASMARPGRDVVRGGDPTLEPLERQARAIAADQAEEWVDATLRALTAALTTSSPTATPELRCVRAGEMGVEVLLAHPLPVAPEGWEAADGGHVWRVPADVDLAELQRRGGQYPVLAPALVSLGSTPEGPILADLEGFGALSVEGDATRVRAFLAGAALELATASWAQGVDLRVYGLDGFARLEGAVSDGEELAGEARSTAELVADALAGVSTLAARVAGPVAAEPWYPMVIVVGPDAKAALVAELADIADIADIAAARTGVALVSAGPLPGAEWQLVVGTEGTAVLKPLGLDLFLAGVDDAADFVDEGDGATPGAETSDGTGPLAGGSQYGLIVDDGPSVVVADQGGLDEAVMATALNALATVAELDDVAAPIPFAAPTGARRPGLRRRVDCEVWVSVLRRAPEVTGWAKEPKGRRKLVEVLVYLAVYAPKRLVPADELRTHCWPAQLKTARPGERERLQEVSADTFHQAVSRLRKQLGEGSSGWHLPMAVDGAYGIGAGVGCDWTLFQSLTAAAEAVSRRDTAKAIALYREALELVEGEPFADVPRSSYAWADSEHLVTDIRLAVTKSAHELAEVAMATEPETALWAAQRGLLLLPTQLGLFDTWMTAAGALGDVDGIEQGLQAKCWAHEQLDPEGGVPPETMKLYRHLMGQVTERRMVGQRGG